MHNLQKLWLHIFVASLSIPSIFKISLLGFRETQNQNIAIDPDSWEEGIPKDLYFKGPLYYQDYYEDIAFFRNIYSVGLAFAIFLITLAVFYFVFRKKKPEK